MRRIKLAALLFISGLTSLAQASISVSLDVESLKAAGAQNASSGILVLVVSQDDANFSLPQAGSIIPAGSDDAIVTMWDLTTQSLPDDDFTLLSKSIAYEAGWSAGDPLGLYWFPNLTIGNPVPSADEDFGFFADTSNVQSGDDWIMPTDGVLLHSLKLFTSDADELVAVGPSPSGVAEAGFTIGQSVDAQSPTSVAGQADSATSVTVDWQGGSAPGGGYLIERSLAGQSSFTTVGVGGPNESTFVDASVQPNQSYEYRVTAFNSYGSEVSSIVALNTPEGPSAAIINLATRGLLGDGNNVLISGFIVGGEGDLTILSRSVGPSIVKAGVAQSQASPDPNSTLFSSQSASNDNWEDLDPQLITTLSTQVGAQPSFDAGSLDSAFAAIVGQGAHAVITSDNVSNDKMAVVEIYDANEGGAGKGSARLINLATRGFVGTGDFIMIGGLVIGGEGSMRILIRCIGPGLPPEVPENERLTDPTLQLFSVAQGGFVGSNDDWEDSDRANIVAATQLLPTPQLVDGSKDAALLMDLSAGAYSVFLSGVNGATGLSLLEIWEVPQ